MPASGYYHAMDAQNHDYYISGCGPISAVTCDASQVTSSAAIQSWGSQPPHMSGLCASAGDFTTQSCSVSLGPPSRLRGLLGFIGIDPAKPELTCHYGNGDGSRSVSIRYQCAQTAANPAAQQDPSTQTEYDITFTGPSACAGSSGGLSGGSLFLILFFVAVVVYFGGGVAYNVKVKQMAPGKEAIPQLEYWQQLPGLVKDGCKFSQVKAMGFYESVSGRSTNNSSLKQGLNEDEGLTSAQNDT